MAASRAAALASCQSPIPSFRSSPFQASQLKLVKTYPSFRANGRLPLRIVMTSALTQGSTVQPREYKVQVTHSTPLEKIELFQSLEKWAEDSILPYLKPADKCWQPQDYLPDPGSEGFVEQWRKLKEVSAGLPDDYLVCLVGDMITEEALPTYQTRVNALNGVQDCTGASPKPWARWVRAWAAEENRHGDLLNKYLYLTGRVDMRQVEKTIQYLIARGMDVQWENDPYFGFVYTSFQERATFISHSNTARKAKEYGDLKLALVCGSIAADEKRHENAYTKIVEKLFEVDPNGAMLAFENMMRKRITMPAHLMYDGGDENLFESFSLVAQRLKVYTVGDYADILEHLVKRWNVEKMEGLSRRAEEGQDYVCGLASRIRRLDEWAQSGAKKGPRTHNFSWIRDREVSIL